MRWNGKQMAETYVAVHMVFNNLPPLLGVYARHNLQDKIWRDVTFSATCVLCSTEGHIIKTSELTKEDDFNQYLLDNDVKYIVHTSGDQVFIYMATIISQSKKCVVHSTTFGWELQSTSIPWDYDQNIPSDGVSIIDYLTTMGPRVTSFNAMRDDLLEQVKILTAPLCKVEKLHAKYPDMPDPVKWVKGTTSDEKNEYTEFMHRFNFESFANCDKYIIYQMLKSLR